MEEQLLNYFEEIGVKAQEKPILLAVSGGKDSMVMAHLFLKTNIPFEIAHFNFQLRGEESELDQQFINDFAKENNLIFHCKKEDTKKYAEEKKLGIQEAARDLRYQWFESVLQERNIDYVATAHHKDDATETMLFNFIRGGSFSSLKGISNKRNNIIRPLLFANQDEISNYAETNDIKFREDQSNKSIQYSRNRIRHKVIPELKKINPSLIETMSRSAKIYQQGATLINQIIEKELDDIVVVEDQVEKIPIEKIVQSKYKNLLIWHWIKPLNFSSKQVNETLGLLTSESGKKITSSNYQIIRDREFLIAQEVDFTEVKEYTFSTIEELNNSPLFSSEIIDSSAVKFSMNNLTTFFDIKKINFPIVLRKWMPGDSFIPLGMKGKKQKISDLLIQEKVSLNNKEKVLVLTFKAEIAWVLGFRVGEKFKIDSNSIDILKLDYHPK